jgi:hypothetical protein
MSQKKFNEQYVRLEFVNLKTEKSYYHGAFDTLEMLLQLLAGEIEVSEWLDPLPEEFVTDSLQEWAKENLQNLNTLRASGVVDEFVFQQLAEITGIDIDIIKQQARDYIETYKTEN